MYTLRTVKHIILGHFRGKNLVKPCLQSGSPNKRALSIATLLSTPPRRMQPHSYKAERVAAAKFNKSTNIALESTFNYTLVSLMIGWQLTSSSER